MVLRDTPVAAATADTPPRPSAFASAATSTRRWRSPSTVRMTSQRRPIGESVAMHQSISDVSYID